MGVFKDDQIVAKVLGNHPQPINKNDKAKRYALIGGAALVVALAVFAVYRRGGAPPNASVVAPVAVATEQTPIPAINAAPANAVPATPRVEAADAVFRAAPQDAKAPGKKRLPPVIEDVTAEAVEMALAEPAGKKRAEMARNTGTPNSILDEAKKIEDSANGDIAMLEKARAMYQQALESGKLDNPFDTQCLVRLNELTAKLILDPKVHSTEPKAVFCKVEPGDVVEKLAKKYKVNQGQIKRVNHLNDRLNVRLGQTIKMLQGEVVYKVDKEKLTGTLYIDGVFIKRYPVGIGPGSATPKGTFTVENKVPNPDWYYEGKKVPFGDPRNILGTRWIGMAGTYGNNGAGLGVHGTALPESVPGRESKGCVRMHNEDVEELYDFMPQGGKVVIE